MSQLYGIQVLRAVAAFMVAIHHVQPDAASIAAGQGRGFLRSELLPWMAGVDIFFVVSGFIMVHASQGDFGRPGATRLFWARRAARIVPLYWAATTLFLLSGLLLPTALNSGSPGPWQVASSYLFWPAVSTVGLVQPVYSLGWTLNYEMLFYALFGLALALPLRLGVPAVCAALGLLVAVEATAGPLPLPFGFWGQPIVLEFAAGMGLAVLRRRGFRLTAGPRWLLALAGTALFVSGGGSDPDQTVWSETALRGSAAVLLVLAAGTGSGRSAPSALVLALARVGDASYALYLVHPFVIRGLREIVLHAAPALPASLFVVLALGCSVAAALIVHRGFERPATAWLRGRLAA